MHTINTQTVDQLAKLDHKAAVEAAEVLCVLVPFTNITLQNIRKYAAKGYTPNGADAFIRHYPNGSTLFIYTLPI